MDPGTIIALIELLGTCSSKFVDIYKQWHNINPHLQALKRQVDGLTAITRSLSTLFEREAVRDQTLQNEPLWDAVAQSLESCFPTIRALERKLNRIGANDPQIGAANRAAKTSRLLFEKADIERLRSELLTHSVNLHLTVGVVQLLVCSTNPKSFAHEVTGQFERLEAMIAAVDARLARQDGLPATRLLRAENVLASVQLDNNTRSLRFSATQVLTDTSTSASTKLSTTGQQRTMPPPIIFEHIDPVPIIDTDETTPVEVPTRSELGEPMQQPQCGQIQNWVAKSSIPNTTQGPASTAVSAYPTLSSPSIPRSLLSNIDNIEASASLLDRQNEYKLQMIKSMYTQGLRLIAAKQFEPAEVCLNRAFQDARRINARDVAGFDIAQLQLAYALCCVKCSKYDIAEVELVKITQENALTASDTVRILHAYHGLAVLHWAKGNIDAALTTCHLALEQRGHVEAIGRDHRDYKESLRLMTLLSWANGDEARAKMYNTMLPEGLLVTPTEFEQGFYSESRWRAPPVSFLNIPQFAYADLTIEGHHNHSDSGISIVENTSNRGLYWERWKTIPLERRIFSQYLAFSPNNLQIVVGWRDGWLECVDLATRKTLVRFGGNKSLLAVAYSPNGKEVASALANGTVELWDIQAPILPRRLRGHRDEVHAVSYSIDGLRVVSGSKDDIVRVWNTDTCVCVHILKSDRGFYSPLSCSPDGRHVLRGTYGRVYIWDISTGQLLNKLDDYARISDRITAMAFSMDGLYFAIGMASGIVKMYDAATLRQLAVLKDHFACIEMLAFAADGAQIIATADDQAIRIWDVRTTKINQICKTSQRRYGVAASAASPDGNFIVSVFNNSLQIWRRTAQKPDITNERSKFNWLRKRNKS